MGSGRETLLTTHDARRYAAAQHALLVDAHDVVSLEFVRYRSVSNASDHGGHTVALLDEVLRADWVIEAQANGNVAEFDAVKGGIGCHTWSIEKSSMGERQF